MIVLVINCGSSSIKYQLFEMKTETVLGKGIIEKIGEPASASIYKANGETYTREVDAPDHDAAFSVIIENLLGASHGVITSTSEVAAVGHRVVHGAEAFVASTRIDDNVIKVIESCGNLAPLHNPPNLVGIRSATKFFPDVPHVAVFDTAFHQTMPKRSFIYAIPYECYEKHRVRRYGFHGTSHRYVSQRAAELLGKKLADLSAITCHLGNGCSAAAISKGKVIDTSMGFTPLEGLVMGTRSGDIDPAIMFFLARKEGLSMDDMDRILNKESGLKGISGVSNDMREVCEAADAGNEQAKLAHEIFAYRVRKYIGSYLAAIGKTDVIVFTGGIGENRTAVREAACSGLESLGIHFDAAANAALRAREGFFSTPDSPVKLVLIPTNEELLIARDTRDIAQQYTA